MSIFFNSSRYSVQISTDDLINPPLSDDYHNPASLPVPSFISSSSYQTLTDEQISQKAEEILKTGKRFGQDNIAERIVKLSDEAKQLNVKDQARLLGKILEKDDLSIYTWLKDDFLAQMVNRNEISSKQYSAIADSFAQAYQEGIIADKQLAFFLGLGTTLPSDPKIFFDRIRIFFNTRQESQSLHENFSKYLLKSVLVSDPDVRVSGSDFRSPIEGSFALSCAPMLAMRIAADSGDPSMAARIFYEVTLENDTDIEKLLNAIGESSRGFRYSPNVVNFNPMTVLIDSVVQKQKPQQWDDLAIKWKNPSNKFYYNTAIEQYNLMTKKFDNLAINIARYAETSDDIIFFDRDGKPYIDTAQSLSRLLSSSHGDAILTALNMRDDTGTFGRHGHAQQSGKNAIQMGNLLRITAFNVDAPEASREAMEVIQKWIKIRKETLNSIAYKKKVINDLDATQACNDLGMLGAAASDAVQQIKFAQDKQEAAVRTLVDFAVDLVLDIIPAGDYIKKDLKNLFGDRKIVSVLVDNAGKQIGNLTKEQIDELKRKITHEITKDGSEDVARKQVSDLIKISILNGIPRGNTEDGGTPYYNIIQNTIQNIEDDIEDNRR